MTTQTCACSCCVDARARANHDRNPFAGCNCHDYPTNLRCDCPFCLSILNWRPGATEIKLTNDSQANTYVDTPGTP